MDVDFKTSVVMKSMNLIINLEQIHHHFDYNCCSLLDNYSNDREQNHPPRHARRIIDLSKFMRKIMNLAIAKDRGN